eukprot:m.189431 g.189431  ORF g.189431 m.189431 type:complete len:834 (-) comp18207_c0_seq1:34-2535(-)
MVVAALLPCVLSLALLAAAGASTLSLQVVPACSTLSGPFCPGHGTCPRPNHYSCSACESCQGCKHCVCCSGAPPQQPVPPDWAERVAAGQMVFSSLQPQEANFASVGNGFVSGDAGCSRLSSDGGGSCGMVYLNGVFNGNHAPPPNGADALPPITPRRAGVPNPLAVTVANGQRIVGQALDVERGLFLNRTLVTTGCTAPEAFSSSAAASSSAPVSAMVTTTVYAHRQHRQLMVLEIEASNFSVPGASCTVPLASCVLSDVSDFDVAPGPGGGVSLTVKIMEEPPPQAGSFPRLPKTTVGMAHTPIPGSIVLRDHQDKLSRVGVPAQTTPNKAVFLAVFHSSLEPILGADAGDNAGSPVAAAVQDLATFSNMSAETLMSDHVSAWANLWQGGIEIGGNTTVAATVNSSLYYILSAIRADWPYGTSPGGLARDSYQGHRFWDFETWMFPNLVAMFPALAQATLTYREARLPAAESRARFSGFGGAFWPWESALVGFGVSRAVQNDFHEIHITGDIAMAFRLYFRMSQNATWAKEHAWPVVRGSADFFASVVKVDEASGNYTFLGVVPPDERAGLIDSNAYTNCIAAATIDLAAEFATAFGFQPQANWSSIATKMYIPIVELDGLKVHPEFEGYKGQPINQADVALLQYPLDVDMPRWLKANDLSYYQARSSGPATSGFYTGDSAYSIAWLALGNRTEADKQFDLAFSHMDLQGFNVWREKNFGDGGHHNFITGAGGYLQNFVFGYGGLRYTAAGLTMQPVLPPHGVDFVRLRSVSLGGCSFDVAYDDKHLTLDLTSGQGPLEVSEPGEKTQALSPANPRVVVALAASPLILIHT